MSDFSNDNLFERAAAMKSEWEGTDVELAIDKAIADNDLDHLHFLVMQAEAETSRQEFNYHDIY